MVWARATARRDGEERVAPLAVARSVVLDSLQGQRSILVVAADEGAVVGFATSEPTASPRVAEVRFLGVDPDHWGRGVGTTIMARLAEELRSARFSSAQLLVYTDNDPARRLYERMGWIWDGQEPSLHPRSGKPEIRYVRSLVRDGARRQFSCGH